MQVWYKGVAVTVDINENCPAKDLLQEAFQKVTAALAALPPAASDALVSPQVCLGVTFGLQGFDTVKVSRVRRFGLR